MIEDTYFPLFPKEEYEFRYKRAREVMVEKGLDAILVTEFTNYMYLGGQREFRQLTPKARPLILILPLDKEPILIAQVPLEQAMRKGSWIKNIKTWSGMPFSVEPVKVALEELLLTKGRIGMEFGIEQRIGISYNDLMALEKMLPNANFVDASEVLIRLRMIKSQAEIDLIRRACRITGKAFEKLFSTVKLGMTEREILKMMFIYMLEEGADMPGFATVHIWPGAITTTAATDRSLKEGDYLWVDAGAVVNHYKCDFSRNATVGRPSTKHLKTHEVIREITRKCVEMIKAGIKGSEITKFCNLELQKNSIPPKPMGRIGHGIGLDITEPPSIAINDNTILESGMTITIEPGVLTDYGYFVLEENLAVTKNGFERLSGFEPELYVL